MGFPWTFYSNFEAGTNAEWTSESDTGSLLDFPHYSVLAKDPTSLMPFRGAYCARNVLGDTNDHTLTSTTLAIADAGTAYFRWYMGLSSDFRFTADDTFNIFELQQSGGTVEASVGMRVTNSTQLVEIGIGDGTAPTSFAQFPAQLRRWVAIELLATISTAGSGVLTLFVNGAQVATLTSQTHAAAVGKCVLGSQDTLATTLGAIYYDDFIMDESRIYPYRERFPVGVELTKTSHIFVGPGSIDGVALHSLSTGNETLKLYDTDTGTVNDFSPLVELGTGAQTSASGPIRFLRGCYAVLGGTSPRGIVYLLQNTDKEGAMGPLYYSRWGMRHYGNIRKNRAQNV